MRLVHLDKSTNVFHALTNPLGGHKKGNPLLVADDALHDIEKSSAWVLRTWLPTQQQTTIMISFQPETNTVTAFGVFCNEGWMRELIEIIRAQKDFACHPMLIPTLISSHYLKCHFSDLPLLNKEVKNLETMAGVRSFSDRSNAQFLANSSHTIRESVDLKARLMDCNMRLQPMLLCMLDQVANGIDSVDRNKNSESIDLRSKGKQLQNRIGMLRLQRATILTVIDTLTGKTDTTLSAVSRTKC